MPKKKRGTEGAPREPPEGTRDTREGEKRDGLCDADAPVASAETRVQVFFSESLILAQNERW